jgi:hypothetical protein
LLLVSFSALGNPIDGTTIDVEECAMNEFREECGSDYHVKMV